MTARMLFATFALFALAAPAARAQGAPQRPGQGEDFFNLGPIGAAGTPLTDDEAEAAGLGKMGCIRVETVEEGGHAHGRLRAGDVVFVAGGRPFGKREDPVLAFSRAVEDAEAARTPVLKLKVMRDGRPADVELPLEALGPHSRTCPHNCKKCAIVLHRALEALKKLQSGDGSLPTGTGGMNGKIVVTTLSGLAFIASGSGPGRGPYGSEVNKAVAFLMRNAGKETKFGTSGSGGNWSQVNWNVGYAPILLAEACKATGNREILAKIEDLSKAICANQEPSGGWAHGPGGPNALGYVELEIVSNYSLASLGFAKRLGIEVDEETISRAVEWIQATGGGDGGVGYSTRPGQQGHGDAGRTAGAMLAFDALGLERHPFRAKMASYYKRNCDQLIGGHVSPCMHMLAGAFASAKLGSSAWREYWSTYRDVVMSARCPDGTFSARPTRETQTLHSNSDRNMGKAWVTAHFALILAAKESRLEFWGK